MEADTVDSASRRTYPYKASEETVRSESEDIESSSTTRLLNANKTNSDHSEPSKRKDEQCSEGIYRLASTTCKLLTILTIAFTVIIYWLIVRRYLDTAHEPYGAQITMVDTPSEMLAIALHPEDHIFRLPKTIKYDFIVTSTTQSPDGVQKRIYLVNEQFPGPTIECRAGDRLIINATNLLDDSECISLHWHGLNMHSFNHMDGAVGITQHPIGAGSSFIYDFLVADNQSGTFWWHAHSQVQRGDGLYGGFVVHMPESSVLDYPRQSPTPEVLLLVGDWYHQSAEAVLEWFTSVAAIGNEAIPDSLVVNGKGVFDCSMAVPARPVVCQPPSNSQKPSVLDGNYRDRQVRIRFVNVGTLAGFSVQFRGAIAKPITVDGGHEIANSDYHDSVGILYPGERMDLLLNWSDLSPLLTALEIQLDQENFRFPNSALTPNQTFALLGHSTIEVETGATGPIPSDLNVHVGGHMAPQSHFDLETAHGRAEGVDGIQRAHCTQMNENIVLLYTKTEKLAVNSYHPRSYINRTSWAPQTESQTGTKQPLIDLPRGEWDNNQLVPFIQLPSSANNEHGYHPSRISGGTCVDIVINNLDDGAHPFHLHGHSFWVLRSHRSEDRGWGSFNPFAENPSDTDHKSHFELNTFNPIQKDTISVPRRGHVVLRVWTDNPGIWMLHCHILFHQASGMAMAIQVGGDYEHCSWS